MRKILLRLCFVGIFGAFSSLVGNAQVGNTISGFVFGSERQPVADASVELQDEFSRTIGRVRTDASGRYSFSRMSSGRFRVRVFAVPNYEDQDQDVEIQNIFMTDTAGVARVSGSDNVQRDFYLRTRRKSSGSRPETTFAQDIPKAALAKYRAALDALENRNTAQGTILLKDAIELFPEYFDALERLGTEYVLQKHFVPARLLFQVALQVNPRSYKSWYGAAYAYYSVNDPIEALRFVEKAVEINPGSVEALLLNGVLLRRTRKFAESETILKRAKTAANGSVPEVHWHLAELYRTDLKRYRDAITELELYLKTPAGEKNQDEIKRVIVELKERSRTPSPEQ